MDGMFVFLQIFEKKDSCTKWYFPSLLLLHPFHCGACVGKLAGGASDGLIELPQRLV